VLLRGSFNRLYSLVVGQLKGDPLSGHLLVLPNGRRNRIKVLYWDGLGLWVCAKRLEQGWFTWPVSESGQIDSPLLPARILGVRKSRLCAPSSSPAIKRARPYPPPIFRFRAYERGRHHLP